jgi:hypothetical protein
MIYDSFSFSPRLDTTQEWSGGKEKKRKPHSFRILVRNPSFNLRFCADSDDFSRAQKRFVIVLKGERSCWKGEGVEERPEFALLFSVSSQKQHSTHHINLPVFFSILTQMKGR